MSGTTFDALGAARTLREAGFGARQAEAIAGVVRRAVVPDRDNLATKADLDTGLTGTKTEIAMLRADIAASFARFEARLTARIYGGFFAMGCSIIVVMAALKLFA